MNYNSILHFFRNNIYNLEISSYFIYNFSKFPWFFLEEGPLSDLWRQNSISFIQYSTSWTLYLAHLKKTFSDFSLYTLFFRFKWYRYVLFSGLGYKRKFFHQFRIMCTYIADRHWIFYKLQQTSFIFPFRKRNFAFFSPSKGWFSRDYNFFYTLRTPYVYKMKGFMDYRVRRRWIFVRRIKLRGIRAKLSKKQQML